MVTCLSALGSRWPQGGGRQHSHVRIATRARVKFLYVCTFVYICRTIRLDSCKSHLHCGLQMKWHIPSKGYSKFLCLIISFKKIEWCAQLFEHVRSVSSIRQKEFSPAPTRMVIKIFCFACSPSAPGGWQRDITLTMNDQGFFWKIMGWCWWWCAIKENPPKLI